ncbi:CocE/NonD family hydrolase [Flavobacterium phycosphaerae]|uniref:CocE/NonD family hydrolase n=1 Tax=Flavobacterium phycosphaerae TaxID=2697515 RepID=UPI00138A079E|nr:CocE/NonD family hydrolase [Flavobacterium phycosphaerae]
MKQNTTLFRTALLLLWATMGMAQTISFPRQQHTDSLSLAKYMPVLAQKTIAVYQKKKGPNYNDNLFRLQLVAQNYAVVAPIIRDYALESFGDSVSLKAMGIAYRWYANVMLAKPKNKKEFAALFQQQFQKKYDTFDTEGQNMVEGYYNKNLKELRSDFHTKLGHLAGKDVITLENAIALCKSYCSYLVFSHTLALGQEQLKISSDKKYHIDENVIVPLRDGGTVALTVVRSKQATTPLPVVLRFNIYAGNDTPQCKDAANRGFVGVIANTRGKRLSNDAIEPFEHDAKDSYEIIDWISKQPWCNGKVGMYGGSYLGFSQWAAAKYKHPALKTIVPQVSVGIGIDFPKHNGVFLSYMLRWLHFVTNNKLTDLAEFSDATRWSKVFKDYYTSGKPFNTLDSIEGRPNVLFQRWLAHPDYDSYWQNMTPQKEEFADIDIPILTTTGYYDDDQVGALHYYKEYQKWNKNDQQYLLIGPYDHFGAQGYPLATLNDYKIDEVANISIQNIVFQWFDYTLKDGPKPELLKDKVTYQVMGANTWRHAPSIDGMHNAVMRLHVGSHHQLTKTPESTTGFITQEINFKDRTDYKEVSDNAYCGFEAIAPKTLPADNNLMVLESDPLDAPMVLSGFPKAYLDIEINKKDLDIVFQLYEKKPDGSYFALSNNLQRASLAKDRTKRHLLTPNEKQQIPFENTFLTCRQLQKGSRIVILLGVNKTADCQINYGTGKEVSEESIKDAEEPLKIKWYHSSIFELPVQP